MGKTFRGRTEDADSPFLGAEFWRPSTEISGIVSACFESENGPCYVVDLLKPVELEGESIDKVSLGNLTGFRMCLRAGGLTNLQVRDQIHLKCTGLKSTTKGFPRPNFEIEVYRPSEGEKAASSAA